MKKEIRTKNTHFIELPLRSEKERGSLCFAEVKKHIPFTIKRLFCIFDVPEGETRGEHANRSEQVLFCLKGKVRVEIDDGVCQEEVFLERPNVGLFLGKMLWRKVAFLEKGTVLLVLASEIFKESDYVRDYQTFKSYFNKK